MPKLTKEQRSELARQAALKRWDNYKLKYEDSKTKDFKKEIRKVK